MMFFDRILSGVQENKNTGQLLCCGVCLDVLHQIRQKESGEVSLLLFHPDYEMSEHQEILAIEHCHAS